MTLAAYFFWASFAAVAYAYAAYPMVIWCLSRLFGRAPVAPAIDDRQLPSVTLLIAAHNEADVIAQRLENALAMDYPTDRLRIVVASDGSSDGTAALVARFGDRGVTLLDYHERRGKSSVLNAAMASIGSDVVVLSDANTRLEPDAIRNLVRWFDNPDVGVVCGRLILNDPATGKNVDGLYWRYETFLKKCEATLGALLGSNGAIYAMRRELYVPVPANTIVDDFVIPLLAKLRSRCGIVYDCDAVAVEEAAADVASEFNRRARIGAGAFQSLTILGRLIDPRQGWLAFAFLSHKVLRWLCPFALVAMLMSSAILAGQPLYRNAFIAQIAFYLLSVAAMLLPVGVGPLKALRLSTMFAGMNAALALGFWRWARGVRTGAWERTARAGVETITAGIRPNVGFAAMAGLSSSGVIERRGRISTVATRDWCLAAGVAGLSVLVMFDAWRDIARLGLLREELSYVLLAPVVIMWVAAARWKLLAGCPVRRAWVGLGILMLGWLAFWYGYWGDPVLWRAGAVMVTVGAIVSVVGFNVMLRLMPAFAATIFLVPISPYGRYQIAIPLQTVTAQVTQTVCDIVGIYVTRSGNLLSINGADVTVAEACNGMRMVLTLLMVCYVVAFTTPMKWYIRVLLLLASPLVAILANVLRLVPTVWMFGHVSRETADAFHSAAGWIMTVAAFLFLMGIVRLMQWAMTPEAAQVSSAPTLRRTIAADPIEVPIVQPA